jgi:hypothetical protein
VFSIIPYHAATSLCGFLWYGGWMWSLLMYTNYSRWIFVVEYRPSSEKTTQRRSCMIRYYREHIPIIWSRTKSEDLHRL